MQIRGRAMQWFERLGAKYASMREDEQCIWLDTPDGQLYSEIMNESWRDNWEAIIEEVYREHFGA